MNTTDKYKELHSIWYRKMSSEISIFKRLIDDSLTGWVPVITKIPNDIVKLSQISPWFMSLRQSQKIGR